MTSDSKVTAIVLAAGEGTRMKSTRPKVLHEICGRSLLAWAVDTVFAAGVDDCLVVVGHGRDEVEDMLQERYGERVTTVLQPEQRGTGDAVRLALNGVQQTGLALIVYGDCPLIPVTLLEDLIDRARAGDNVIALATGTLEDPSGYGRIIRDPSGNVSAIVEHRDCSPAELAVDEVNPGIYTADIAFLRDAVSQLTTTNAKGEFYLTDVIAMAAQSGSVADVRGPMEDLLGVNDRYELALCGERKRLQIAEALARAGVGMREPSHVYVDADCEIEPGAFLDSNVHLRGRCIVGAGAHIDVGCVLTDCHVATDARVLPYTVATQSKIGIAAQTGPFSHLRPETELGPGSKVGNFSETKKTVVGEGSKVNHLSYVGDGVIGKNVNIGAGTIFCNYDGAQKHTTRIEDDVFIGSDSQLIAPVTVGKGAYVASGTTVTQDVPADALAVGRAKQDNKKGYAPRLRARQKKAKKK